MSGHVEVDRQSAVAIARRRLIVTMPCGNDCPGVGLVIDTVGSWFDRRDRDIALPTSRAIVVARDAVS